MTTLILGAIIGGAIGYSLGAHLTLAKMADEIRADVAALLAKVRK